MSATEQLDVVRAVELGKLTHEQAANMMIGTATGRAAGMCKEEVLKDLHIAFPSQRALSAYMKGFLTMFNAGKTRHQQLREPS